MNRNLLRVAAAAAVLAARPAAGTAQHRQKDIDLHVDTRWDECAFLLDASLTQAAWRQFTEEAALVAYLRPLSDARPLGAGRWEVSLLRWATAIDDADSAWNDTFVHPHETHWLFDGSRLAFPGLMVRAGVTDRIDLGGYLTKNPNSNYGFYGAHVQGNVVNDTTGGWAAAARLSFVSLFGPDDLDHAVLGFDLLGSRTFPVTAWLTVSPYVGLSSYIARAHEKSALVDLDDEIRPGSQAMLGASAQIGKATVALEFSSAKVETRSLKVAFAF